MDIRDVTKLFDLEYYDGPLLSLFADANGDFYLYKWYDLAPDSHQWLVWRVPYETLLRYLNGLAPEFELLRDALGESYYLVEFSGKGQPVIIGTITRNHILDEYSELKTVYFDQQLCPNWRAVRHFFQAPLEPATA
ncbi:MAG: hypothetical protein JNJ90_11405 [Saprospiraceae bacterium]|jgi:hypothetical protein|nr:hypothetical protein [Saprospiraceae bacterium]